MSLNKDRLITARDLRIAKFAEMTGKVLEESDVFKIETGSPRISLEI